eukprot:TRINITY_DN1305_c0_g1_i1.p1 TRINITY_DN1305_c0_g1~~TRINITY_DN1305_c0_g1_i1.p1  ORF type:complete len:293 (+),score=80.73 TRINITY_DN1305_c0_g1_i1:69-947(+)
MVFVNIASVLVLLLAASSTEATPAPTAAATTPAPTASGSTSSSGGGATSYTSSSSYKDGWASNENHEGVSFSITDDKQVSKADCTGTYKNLYVYGNTYTSGDGTSPSDTSTEVYVSYSIEVVRQCTAAESDTSSSGYGNGALSSVASGCCADKTDLYGSRELHASEMTVGGIDANPLTGSLTLSLTVEGSTPEDDNASSKVEVDLQVSCTSVVKKHGSSTDERCFEGACATIAGTSKHVYCSTDADQGGATVTGTISIASLNEDFDFSALGDGVTAYGDIDKGEESRSTSVA